MSMRNDGAQYRAMFLGLLQYHLLFLLLQFAIVLSQSHSFIHTLPLPKAMYLEIGETILVHCFLYVICSAIEASLLFGLTTNIQQQTRLKPVLAFGGIGTILTANAYFFPLSIFSRFGSHSLPHPLLTGLLILFCGAWMFIIGIYLIRIRQQKRLMILSTIITITLTASILQSHQVNSAHSIAQAEHAPHIILIGIDSFSPNELTKTVTPTLFHFAQHGVFYQNTISPLARTYPAWVSILTGLYPKHHGARYNLISPTLVHRADSIAWRLQKKGYLTLFATDDRRFNHLDETFGFQTIIGPKMTVNDYLLGTFNDFPLSNLLINHPLARWIFPYNYLNRASHYSYYPSSFTQALTHWLTHQSAEQPTFMSVHFTLPHWPYAFASSSPIDLNDEYSVLHRGKLHQQALHAVDHQVSVFLNDLKQRGYLEHSLVILLSDHGEALYVPGSRMTSASNYQGHGISRFSQYLRRHTSTELDKSAGHGSDLLSPTQYHCFLAIQFYQHHHNTLPPHHIKARVALIDLAPTILDILHLSTHHPMDGISLKKTLFKKTALPNRAFLLESGMLPNQFLSKNKARQLASTLFTINPKTHQLELTEQALNTLNQTKLYGILQDDWVLALYPYHGDYLTILQRLSDGQWTDQLISTFAQQAPVSTLIKQLHDFYGNELMLKRNHKQSSLR